MALHTENRYTTTLLILILERKVKYWKWDRNELHTYQNKVLLLDNIWDIQTSVYLRVNKYNKEFGIS